MQDNFVKDMYAIVDSRDPQKFSELFAEDGVFKFANMPAVEGKGNILDFVKGFFQSIKDIGHDQIEDWQVNGTRFATGRVTYTRHDNSELVVPFSVLLRMNDNLIKDYLVYVDASELYKDN